MGQLKFKIECDTKPYLRGMFNALAANNQFGKKDGDTMEFEPNKLKFEEYQEDNAWNIDDYSRDGITLESVRVDANDTGKFIFGKLANVNLHDGGKIADCLIGKFLNDRNFGYPKMGSVEFDLASSSVYLVKTCCIVPFKNSHLPMLLLDIDSPGGAINSISDIATIQSINPIPDIESWPELHPELMKATHPELFGDTDPDGELLEDIQPGMVRTLPAGVPMMGVRPVQIKANANFNAGDFVYLNSSGNAEPGFASYRNAKRKTSPGDSYRMNNKTREWETVSTLKYERPESNPKDKKRRRSGMVFWWMISAAGSAAFGIAMRYLWDFYGV